MIDVAKKHQIRIAERTLQMNDVFARIMGGPSKEEARRILRAAGYSESRIKMIEEGKAK